MPQVNLINTQQSWENTAARLFRERELAVDTESNSLYRYRERICLVQIATRQEVFLLDPLAVKDLSSLGRLLAEPSVVKVLHGSDYDIRSLDRDYGFNVASLFDTETASRFLGETSPNLASVLESFLGVEVPKSRKLQRSDWGVRPLSPLALEYARNDVRYLVRLADELRRRLEQLRRLEWAQEEFHRLEQVRHSPPSHPPEEGFLRVKGSDQLAPRALSVLKELFLWREAEARRLDQPPFRVLGNETLLKLARTWGDGASPVSADVLNAFPPVPRRSEDGVRAAIHRGRARPGFHRPRPIQNIEPWTPESRGRLQRLKRWRTDRGAALGLDPALLWPAASLERLALQPQSWRAELLEGGTDQVRAWQRREFGEELRAVLEARG